MITDTAMDLEVYSIMAGQKAEKSKLTPFFESFS